MVSSPILPPREETGNKSLCENRKNSTNHLEASLGVLTKGLKNPDVESRQAALDSLRRIGVELRNSVLAQRMMLILNPLTKDDDQWVRSDTEHALKELSQLREQAPGRGSQTNE